MNTVAPETQVFVSDDDSPALPDSAADDFRRTVSGRYGASIQYRRRPFSDGSDFVNGNEFRLTMACLSSPAGAPVV
ncbi:MAG TPA: hypothetical protein PLX65_11085 [Accumulibacter sp.]|nr:hypothetical protein [Accumulibacter sp.]